MSSHGKNAESGKVASLIVRLLAFVRNRRMEPGERLPSERLLAERFEVTREVTREALAVLESLRRAVERRLVADVPVGCLLSGGVDSSLIVGLLAEAGQHGLSTFSIGFESVGGVGSNIVGIINNGRRRICPHGNSL